MAYRPWDASAARSIITSMRTMAGAAMPILHALQEEFGFVHDDAVPLIADALNLSKAEIFGTLTYYHEFRRELPGGQVLRICRAEACQSVGCEELVDHLAASHGITMDATTSDRRLTVETVYCLGNCALGPSIMLGHELIGRVNADLLDDICAQHSNERMGVEA